MSETDTSSPFEALAARLLAAELASGKRASELQSKRSILLRHLLPALGGLALRAIASREIEAYKRQKLEQGLTPKSINNHLAVLRRLLELAFQEGNLDALPSIGSLPVPARRATALDAPRAARLLEAADSEARCMIFVALKSGVSLGELRGLQWNDVALGAATLTVRRALVRSVVVPARAWQRRELPLTAAVCSTLATQPRRSEWVFCNARGAPLSAGACKWPLYRAARRAGLPLFGWHVLRNTFALELLLSDTPLPELQRLLGHRSLRSTKRYVAALAAQEHLQVKEPAGQRHPSLGLLVFVTDDRRQLPWHGLPLLGVLAVAMCSCVPGRERAGQYGSAPSDVRRGVGQSFGHYQDGALAALGHGHTLPKRGPGLKRSPRPAALRWAAPARDFEKRGSGATLRRPLPWPALCATTSAQRYGVR